MRLMLAFCLTLFISCKWSFAQWSAIGSGFNDNYVAALFNYNNTIYIGGNFHSTPGNTFVGSWDGSNLSAVSPNLESGAVNAITIYNGELVGLGNFRQFQSSTIPNGTVRWDGTNWYNLGAGLTSMGTIYAAAAYQGSLYIGGSFTQVDNVNRRCIARWDGSQWHSVGIGLSTGLSYIQCMAVYNGELYIGGYFSSIAGVSASCIAKFNGTTWVQVAAGLNDIVKCLYVDSVNNRLYACGNFNASGTTLLPSNIAYWDGSSWNAVAHNQSIYPNTVSIYKNQLYTGFTTELVNTTGDTLRYIARWDGVDWQPLDSGLNSTVKTMVVYGDDLIVGGGFTTADTITANRIAKWHYSPVTVNEVEVQKQSFEIVPNPNNGNFIINYQLPQNKSGTLQIMDVLGKQVYSQPLPQWSTMQRISLPNIPAGVYIIKLTCGKNSIFEKIIKE